MLSRKHVPIGGALAALLAAVLAHAASAQATGAGDARTLLAAEIARIEGDIAALDELAAWQREMIRAAASDPAGTLRQRRPMAQCRASPLAPACDVLTALFRDDAAAVATGSPATSKEDAP